MDQPSDAEKRSLNSKPKCLKVVDTFRTTSPYVFWHDDGARYSTFANSFSIIAKKADVPFRCHDLRHRFAFVFIQATGDIPALQAILGHKTIAMTMRYAHIVTDHLHRAMEALGTKPAQSARFLARMSLKHHQIL